MANRPIEIPISVTADGAEKGVSKVADAFDDLEGSLKDVSKAGDKSAKDLKSDMSDAAKQIDRDLTRALDDVEQQAKKSGKTVSKSMQDGTREAGEATKTFKDESRQNLSESVSSFRGDIEDIPQLLQDILGGVSADLSAVGGLFAVGFAAAIGVAIAALQGQAEEINNAKQNVLDLAKVIRENGGTFEMKDAIQAMDDYGDSIVNAKDWWEVFQKDAVSGWEELRRQSDVTGLSLDQLFNARFADNAEASQKALDTINKKLEDQKKALNDAEYANTGLQGSEKIRTDGLRDDIKVTEDAKKAIEDHNSKLRAADEVERIRRQSIEGTTEALKENIEALEKRTDATKASMSSELDYLDGVDTLNSKLAENGATLDIHTEKGRDNARAVLSQAQAIEQMSKDNIDAGQSVDEVTKKFNSQKDALIDQVTPAFGGSKEAARQYIDQILQAPKTVSTTVELKGVAEAEAKIRQFLDQEHHLFVNIKTGDTSSVDNYIEGMNGKNVFADFAPRGGVAYTN